MHLHHLNSGCSPQPDNLDDSAPVMASCWQLNHMCGSGHLLGNGTESVLRYFVQYKALRPDCSIVSFHANRAIVVACRDTGSDPGGSHHR